MNTKDFDGGLFAGETDTHSQWPEGVQKQPSTEFKIGYVIGVFLQTKYHYQQEHAGDVYYANIHALNSIKALAVHFPTETLQAIDNALRQYGVVAGEFIRGVQDLRKILKPNDESSE